MRNYKAVYEVEVYSKLSGEKMVFAGAFVVAASCNTFADTAARDKIFRDPVVRLDRRSKILSLQILSVED